MAGHKYCGRPAVIRIRLLRQLKELLIRPRTICPDGIRITGGSTTACPLSFTFRLTTDRRRLRLRGRFAFRRPVPAPLTKPPEYEYGKTRRTPRQAARHR